MRMLQSFLLAAALAAAACAPRGAGTQHLFPAPELAPSGAPSAEPAPLPTYPYEPGYWV